MIVLSINMLHQGHYNPYKKFYISILYSKYKKGN
jgi:hypothetical protein